MTDKPVRSKPNLLLQGESLLIAQMDYFEGVHYANYDVFFNKKQHRLNADHISYRVINHWEKLGIITADRPNGTGWRTYSFIEVVWIQVVSELRKFNFPLEKIQVAKNTLKRLYGSRETDYAPLEFFSSLALVYRMPIYVFVFWDGKVQVGTNQDRTISLESNLLDNHLSISLNDILQKLLPTSNVSPVFETLVPLSKEEVEAIFLLRTGNFESITLIPKDGKIERIDVIKTVNINERITDLLKDSKYQDVEIKIRGGQVRTIKRKVLKKFL